ncbi:hypothetical protein CBL_12824 [Carabus blaptoides fortunei]
MSRSVNPAGRMGHYSMGLELVTRTRNGAKVRSLGEEFSRKELGTADILSRRPLSKQEEDTDLDEQIEAHVRLVTNTLPASDMRLAKIIEAQTKDEICAKLKTFIRRGWPNENEIST